METKDNLAPMTPEGSLAGTRSLGQVMASLTPRLRLIKPAPAEQDPADLQASCKVCGGRGLVIRGIERGEVVVDRCEVCKPRSDEDFFAHLKVKPGNKQAVELARSFATKPDGWIVLLGKPGTGKTRLLDAIVSIWAAEKRFAMTAAQLLDIWRGSFDGGDFLAVFTGWCEGDAIVLDDLGAEKATDWALERLTMFLDYRYHRALPTAIATNYDHKGLEARLGGRIADRVFDTGTGLVRIATLSVPSWRYVSRGERA